MYDYAIRKTGFLSRQEIICRLDGNGYSQLQQEDFGQRLSDYLMEQIRNNNLWDDRIRNFDLGQGVSSEGV